MKKIETIDELRNEFDRLPQFKLQFAAAISQLLTQYELRATGTLLGSLSLASVDELEQLGKSSTHERAAMWTI
jgi:hypothetical protein